MVFLYITQGCFNILFVSVVSDGYSNQTTYPLKQPYCYILIISQSQMELLPLVILFLLAIIILVGVFILLSFIYFKIKHKKNILNQEFHPGDVVDDPYIEMMPLNLRTKKQDIVKQTVFRQSSRNLNLSRMKTSQTPSMSLSISIPTINNNKSLHTTALLEDMLESDQKFSYISKLVNYTQDQIQVHTYDVTTITSCRVYRNLNWQYDFKIYPIIDSMLCKKNQEGFNDLLDVFKLQVGQHKAVKFVVEVMIKNCLEDRTYEIYDLTKFQMTETITVEEFQILRESLTLKYKS